MESEVVFQVVFVLLTQNTVMPPKNLRLALVLLSQFNMIEEN